MKYLFKSSAAIFFLASLSTAPAAFVLVSDVPVFSDYGVDTASPTSDYFGPGTDNAGSWAITSTNGHTSNLNLGVFAAADQPPASTGGDPIVFGRDINHINDDGGGNRDYRNETVTWSLAIPVEALPTNLVFSVEGAFSEDTFEGNDDLDFELFINGVSVATAPSIEGIDGGGSFSFPALFSDGLGDSSITSVSVVHTVGVFNGANEAFWLTGSLSVMIPEPSRIALILFGGLALILRRSR